MKFACSICSLLDNRGFLAFEVGATSQTKCMATLTIIKRLLQKNLITMAAIDNRKGEQNGPNFFLNLRGSLPIRPQYRDIHPTTKMRNFKTSNTYCTCQILGERPTKNFSYVEFGPLPARMKQLRRDFLFPAITNFSAGKISIAYRWYLFQIFWTMNHSSTLFTLM